MTLTNSIERTNPIPQSQQAIPTPDDVLELVKTFLDDDKAEDIAVIDLEGKTEIKPLKFTWEEESKTRGICGCK